MMLLLVLINSCCSSFEIISRDVSKFVWAPRKPLAVDERQTSNLELKRFVSCRRRQKNLNFTSLSESLWVPPISP